MYITFIVGNLFCYIQYIITIQMPTSVSARVCMKKALKQNLHSVQYILK